MAETLGVLVAGGRGVRLGLPVPKAFAEVGGITLLERASRTLARACDEIVVTAPADLPLPPHAHARVADIPGAAGPLAGLVAGLAARPFTRALALGVDFPLARAEALRVLLERLGGFRAVVPVPGGVPQPLAAAYAPTALTPLARSLAAGERAVTAAVMALEPLLLSDAEIARLPGGDENFFNLNTPADLVAAERFVLAARGERSA